LRAAAAALCVLLAATGARAADWCFDSISPPNPAPPNDPDILVVASDFKMPKKGKCKPISGFEVGFSNQTFPRPASGSACLDTAGTHLHVGIVIHSAKGPAPVETDSEIHFHMYVPYPALEGGQVYLRRDLPGLGVEREDGRVAKCALRVPIP
jgi:hypothetical protein